MKKLMITFLSAVILSAIGGEQAWAEGDCTSGSPEIKKNQVGVIFETRDPKGETLNFEIDSRHNRGNACASVWTESWPLGVDLGKLGEIAGATSERKKFCQTGSIEIPANVGLVKVLVQSLDDDLTFTNCHKP